MEQNISMLRFLMFMILALIIFFNLASNLEVSEESTKTTEKTTTGGESSTNSTSDTNYCLLNESWQSDKTLECKIKSSGEICKTEFKSKPECIKWKNVIERDDSKRNGDDNLSYEESIKLNLTPEQKQRWDEKINDVDQRDKLRWNEAGNSLVIMSSDDMIYCLKKDMECKKMKLKECEDDHISSHHDKANCESAKSQQQDNSGKSD